MEIWTRNRIRRGWGRVAALTILAATWTFVLQGEFHQHPHGPGSSSTLTLSGDHAHPPVPIGPCQDCVTHHDPASVPESVRALDAAAVVLGPAARRDDLVPRSSSRFCVSPRAPPVPGLLAA